MDSTGFVIRESRRPGHASDIHATSEWRVRGVSRSDEVTIKADANRERIVGFVARRSAAAHLKHCPISVPKGLHEVTSYRLTCWIVIEKK